MKKLYSCLASLSLLYFLSGCKKEEVVYPDFFPESVVHLDDQSRFTTEMDAVANDVNFALEMTPGFSGKPASVTGVVCDATIVADTISNPRVITITYNGTNCVLGRKRTGRIIITMANNIRWKNPGAVVNVSFVNFKMTRLKDNKELVINNKAVFTNVSGGLLNELSTTVSSITHTIFSEDIDLTFDNGKEWSWKMARQRVYRDDNGLVITTTGLQPHGNVLGVADWGNNRYGNPFLTPILIPLITRQDCNFRIVEGKFEIILTGNLYATAKLGLDASGSPISCPGTDNYYLEMLWRDHQGLRRIARLPY